MDHLEQCSDAELLTRTGSQPEAFGVFYRRYERPILVYATRRCATPDAAADLCAEVFASALASSKRYRAERGPAIAWLYGIASNTLSASRRRGRVADGARKRLQMEPLVLDDEDLERVEAVIDAQRVAPDLQEMLDTLPVDQRDAVLARIVDEQAYDEIAADLKCSPAVVRQRVSRGLNTLRFDLTKESA